MAGSDIIDLLSEEQAENRELFAEQVPAEENDAEQLLAEMDDMDPSSDEFDADRREQLGRGFTSLRDHGPTRTHPNTPGPRRPGPLPARSPE